MPDLDSAFPRIEEYSYSLEDARPWEACGLRRAINKVLVLNGDVPGRISVILIKAAIGF